jgi:hypothetical protein
MTHVFCCVLETAGLRTTDRPWRGYRLFSTEPAAKQCLTGHQGTGRVEIWPIDHDGVAVAEVLWFKTGYRPCGPDDLQPDEGPVAIYGAPVT